GALWPGLGVPPLCSEMTPPLVRLGSVTTPGTFAMGALLYWGLDDSDPTDPRDSAVDLPSPCPVLRRPGRRATQRCGRKPQRGCSPGMEPDRRGVLRMMGVATAAAVAATGSTAAPVRWSGGTERPKLKPPPNA